MRLVQYIEVNPPIAALPSFTNPSASTVATGEQFLSPQAFGIASEHYEKTATGWKWLDTRFNTVAAGSLIAIEQTWAAANPLPSGSRFYGPPRSRLQDGRGIPAHNQAQMDRNLIPDALTPRNEGGSISTPLQAQGDADALSPLNTPTTTITFAAVSNVLQLINAASMSLFSTAENLYLSYMARELSGGDLTLRYGLSANDNGSDGQPGYADNNPGTGWSTVPVKKIAGYNASTTTRSVGIRPITGSSPTNSRIAFTAAYATDDWGGTEHPTFAAMAAEIAKKPLKAPTARRGSITLDGPFMVATTTVRNLVCDYARQTTLSSGFNFAIVIDDTRDTGAATSAANSAVSWTRQSGATSTEQRVDLQGNLGVYANSGKPYLQPGLSFSAQRVLSVISGRGAHALMMNVEPLTSTTAKVTLKVNGVLMFDSIETWSAIAPALLAIGGMDSSFKRAQLANTGFVDKWSAAVVTDRSLSHAEMTMVTKAQNAYLKAQGHSGLKLDVLWVIGADSTNAFGDAPPWSESALRPLGELEALEAWGGTFFNNTPKTDASDRSGIQFNDAWRQAQRRQMLTDGLLVGYGKVIYRGIGSVNDLVTTRALSDTGFYGSWLQGRITIFNYAVADKAAVLAPLDSSYASKLKYVVQTINPRADFYPGGVDAAPETIRLAFNADLRAGYATSHGLDGYFDREVYNPQPTFGFANLKAAGLDALNNGSNGVFVREGSSPNFIVVHWAPTGGVDAAPYEVTAERQLLARL